MESLYDMPYPQFEALAPMPRGPAARGQRPPSLASLSGPICGIPGALEEPHSDCFSAGHVKSDYTVYMK